MASGPHPQSIRRFFSWWGAELRALLPAALRRPAAAPDALVLVAEAEDAAGLRIVVRRRGRERPLGPADGVALRASDRRLPVHLRLEEGLVLRRRLTLPLDAEGSLHEAIAFQIDGLTPFKREEVGFGFRIEERDPPAGMLSVLLAVVPRRRIASALETASALGLPVAAAEAPAAGTPVVISLGSQREGAPAGRGAFRIFTLLAVVALALAGLTTALPLYQLEQRHAFLVAETQEARAEALVAQDLRDRLAAVAEGGRFFAERKQPDRLAIDVMNEMTRLLPDSAWLTGLMIEESEVLLSGYAANASGLLAELEESPLFENVRFRSPVIREGAENLERFELSGGIVAAAKL